MVELVDTGIIDQHVDLIMGTADLAGQTGGCGEVGDIRLPGLDRAGTGQGAQFARRGRELAGIAAMDEQGVPERRQAQGGGPANPVRGAGDHYGLGGHGQSSAAGGRKAVKDLLADHASAFLAGMGGAQMLDIERAGAFGDRR